MRRLLLFGTTCAFLVACSPEQSVVPNLPPEEVLENAAKATQSLESAQYVVQSEFDASADAWSAVGSLRMDGMLQSAGEQLRFQLDITADVEDVQGSSSIDGTLEVAVISEEEVYMNLHSLIAQPSSTFFNPEMIGAIAGQWWLLPPGDTLPVSASVTPDPRLLQMQSQVISVTRDRGVDTVQGRPSYQYDVVLDKEKLLLYLSAVAKESGQEFDVKEAESKFALVDASGQIWIDAETYYMQKLSWVIQSLPLDNGGEASVSFTITFRNHNEAPTIQPPTDAKPFTPTVFFSLPNDALFPEELPPGALDSLNDESIDELIRQMNSLQ